MKPSPSLHLFPRLGVWLKDSSWDLQPSPQVWPGTSSCVELQHIWFSKPALHPCDGDGEHFDFAAMLGMNMQLQLLAVCSD